MTTAEVVLLTSKRLPGKLCIIIIGLEWVAVRSGRTYIRKPIEPANSPISSSTADEHVVLETLTGFATMPDIVIGEFGSVVLSRRCTSQTSKMSADEFGYFSLSGGVVRHAVNVREQNQQSQLSWRHTGSWRTAGAFTGVAQGPSHHLMHN